MKTYAKFAALVAIIVGALAWLAVSGAGEAASYYKTVSELDQMGTAALGKKIRVAGDVEPGSIERSGGHVRFVLTWEKKSLPVIYKGTDPLPDTFQDGAQAVAQGRMGANGTFEASNVQAKCASKYEAKPGARPAGPPVRPGVS